MNFQLLKISLFIEIFWQRKKGILVIGGGCFSNRKQDTPQENWDWVVSLGPLTIAIFNRKQDTPQRDGDRMVNWDLLTSTGNKIRHRKIWIRWSVGVLLRLLSSTVSKIRHRKMGIGQSIGVLLRLLSLIGSKRCYKNKRINCYKISIILPDMR